MNDLYYLAPLGIILLSALTYLGRLERNPALRLWLYGFLALFGGAVFILPNSRIGWAVTSLCSAAFAAFMYAGSMRFAEREVPRWLVPSAVLVGGLRALSTLADWPGPLSAIAGLYVVALLGIGGQALRRRAAETRAGLAERALGPAMMGLGALMGVSIAVRFAGIHGGAMFSLWISATGLVALLQTLSSLERTRRREGAHQQKLTQQQRTLRAVIETAPLDILLLDERGGVRMANHSAARRFGIALDPAGEPLAGQALPARLRVQVEGASDPADDPLGPAAFEPEPGRHNHDDESLEVFTSPVVSAGGESLGRLWIGRDTTHERRLQQQLVQSQKMETLGTLAGGIAHDFNNQLTTILGNARIASQELDDRQSVARECLDDLSRAADHCAKLTEGLLAFARRTPTASQALEVGAMLAEVEALLRATLPSRVELVVDREAGLAPARADATQLKQVLLNLAINGRDAIEGRGTIRLGAHEVSFSAPRATASGEAAAGRYVELSVEDTGRGIDPACRRRIFDPFFTTKPTGEGTGLGLAIAYGVVKAHRGYIDLDSRPGCTRVRVGVPIAESASPHVVGRAEPVPRGAGETVLLADDEPALRRLLVGQLSALGYRVLEADSGEQAVEIGAEPDRKIDVAVLDLSMPGIDGLDALEALRASRPGLPGLIVSGFLDVEAEQRLPQGVEVVAKPFDEETLARAIRRALRI